MSNILSNIITKLSKEDDGRTLRGYIADAFSNISNRLYSMENSYNEIIADSGNSNREIVDARVDGINKNTFDTLKERMDSMQVSINKMLDTDALLNKIYPIGMEVIFASDFNPNEGWYGTWARTAKGRMIMGVNENDSEFATVGKEAGSKTHKHSSGSIVANIGAINGRIDSIGYKATVKAVNDYIYGIFGVNSATSSAGQIKSVDHATTTSGSTSNTSTLPPYVTAYIWKRVA